MQRIPLLFMILITVYESVGQVSPDMETNLAGVYQGNTLFIQNPYLKDKKSFCIREIQINEQRLDINYNMSAIKLDFDEPDLFAPVKIRILHSDTTCSPVIINPEAILFHTIFRFASIQLSDSVLTWTTKGERGRGTFEIEKLDVGGYWVSQEKLEASGKYERAAYLHYPNMDEGANKYRIRYNFPYGSRAKYLFSQEVELEYYPEKVDFNPKSAKTRLFLSRATHYEIYDQGNNLVLEGQGKEIDVTVLRRGRYVIYFNGRFPGGFYKE